MYFSCPFLFGILQRWPHLRRVSSITGLAIAATSLVTASFANEVWHLILSQGALYAIGGSLLYTPVIFYVDEWFVRRKGLAYGVMWAGTGTGGVIIPLIMNWGLGKYGFRIMLRAWSIVMVRMPSSFALEWIELTVCVYQVSLTAPLIYFVKPRLPISRTTGPRRVDFDFLKSSTFWILQGGNILESFGFFMPSIYLPCKHVLPTILMKTRNAHTFSLSLRPLNRPLFSSRYSDRVTPKLRVCCWCHSHRCTNRPSSCNHGNPYLDHRLRNRCLPRLGPCSLSARSVRLRPVVRHLCRWIHIDVDWLRSGDTKEVPQCGDGCGP